MVRFPSCISPSKNTCTLSSTAPPVPVRGAMAPLVAGSKGKEEQKED